MGISIPALALGSTAGLEGGGLGALFSGLFGGGAAAAGAGAGAAGLAGAGLGTAEAIGAPLSLSALDYGGALGASALGAGAGGALEAGAIGGLGGDLATGGLLGSTAAPVGGAIGGLGGDLAAGGSPTAGALPTATPAIGGTGGGSAAGLAGPAGVESLNASGSGLANIGASAGGATQGGGGLFGGLGNFAASNKGLLTTLGAPLAAPLVSKLVNPVPQEGALKGLAAQSAALTAEQGAYGKELQQGLLTGKLPSGAQAEVNNALGDATAATKARYASLGLTGSTMEQQALTDLSSRGQELTFKIAQQMAQTGQAAIGQAANSLGLQDQVYAQLMNAQVAQDNSLQQAIARMAAAAAGGGNKAV